jgi:uncharacterized YigZ family protein
MTEDFFYTLGAAGNAEYKDRGSRFVAFASPVNSIGAFKQFLDTVRKEHPKATHHCFAYRIGIDGNTFRVSDDGEPSGTAGRPILGQIDSKQLLDACIIVVRYFGGTLLGVPGLINAYKTAASLVLQTTPVIQKAIEVDYNIQFDYTQMNEVMHLLKQYNATIIEKEMNLFCRIKAGIQRSRMEEAIYQLKEMPNVDVQKA